MKRFLNVSFLLLLLPGVAAAQQHRNLLQRFSPQMVMQSVSAQRNWHPFPQSPEGWRALLDDSSIAVLIGKGEAALQKEFKPLPATLWMEFVRTGNRVNFEGQSFAKRNQLWDLVLAESVEGKGRFTDQILNGVWSICEETFWGLPAHVGMQKAGRGLPDAADPVVDLFAAETAAVLAWTDYFAGNALQKISPLIRSRIYSEVNRRIFKPILTAKYEYMGYGDFNAKVNNWAPWIMSNYITAALVLEPDSVKRTEAMLLAMKYTDQYLNGLGEDGAGDEGPLYWFAAGGTAFDALTLLFDASGGKLNVFNEPFIQKMGAYVYKTHIAGRYFINIADAPPEISADGYMLYRFGKATSDRQMMLFGSRAAAALRKEKTISTNEQFFRTRVLYNMVAARECAAYPDSFKEVAGTWFPDIQLMTRRTQNGLFIATHGGNNGESHNHNDVGDFLIYADGEPLIIDAGAGTYTARTFSGDRYSLWFNTSSYHNLPSVNNIQQRGGAAFKADAVHYMAGNKESSLSMNIARAYDSAAGLLSWIRDVRVKRSGTIEISDRYKLKNEHNRITQSFMTVCDADISAPGKIVFTLASGKKAYLEYDAAQWNVSKETVPLTQPEDAKFKISWHGKDIWRVLLTNNEASSTGKVLYRIYLLQ